MKKLTVYVVTLCGLLILLGCHRQSTNPEPSPRVVGSVELHMSRAIIHYMPGDSVSVTGFATVKDTSGLSVPRMQLHFGTTLPFGRIEYQDSILRDRTDDSGKVNFRFASFGPWTTDGLSDPWNAVTVEIGGHFAYWLLSFSPARIPEEIAVLQSWVTPDTVWLHAPGGDSVRVFAQYLSFIHSIPVAGVVPPFRVEGALPVAMPASDTTGITTVMWRPARVPGRYCSIVGHGYHADTLWVTVLP